MNNPNVDWGKVFIVFLAALVCLGLLFLYCRWENQETITRNCAEKQHFVSSKEIICPGNKRVVKIVVSDDFGSVQCCEK